jgi:hypothetical protein
MPWTRKDEYEALTPEQVAALAEFDRAVNRASDAELPQLVVPPVLGPRYGGGLRLRGASALQLKALRDLHKAQERVLARSREAVRAYLKGR